MCSKLLALASIYRVYSSLGYSQSIHQQDLEYHNALGNASAEYYESLPVNKKHRKKSVATLPQQSSFPF